MIMAAWSAIILEVKKELLLFMGVARRNLRASSYEVAKNTIINSIKNGSKGKYAKFSDEMPAFSYFSHWGFRDYG